MKGEGMRFARVKGEGVACGRGERGASRRERAIGVWTISWHGGRKGAL